MDDATVRDRLDAALRRLVRREAAILLFWFVRDPLRATCRLEDLLLRRLLAVAVVLLPAFGADFFLVDGF